MSWPGRIGGDLVEVGGAGYKLRVKRDILVGGFFLFPPGGQAEIRQGI